MVVINEIKDKLFTKSQLLALRVARSSVFGTAFSEQENLNPLYNYLEKHLRIGLMWDLHKRVFPLFKSHYNFESSLRHGFLKWLKDENANPIITVKSMYSADREVGVNFSLDIDLYKLIFYFDSNFTNLHKEDIILQDQFYYSLLPLDNYILIKYKDSFDDCEDYYKIVKARYSYLRMSFYTQDDEEWKHPKGIYITGYKSVE